MMNRITRWLAAAAVVVLLTGHSSQAEADEWIHTPTMGWMFAQDGDTWRYSNEYATWMWFQPHADPRYGTFATGTNNAWVYMGGAVSDWVYLVNWPEAPAPSAHKWWKNTTGQLACGTSLATCPNPGAGNVVYVHGRGMALWPATAFLRSSTAWTHRTMVFDGSGRLGSANDAVPSYIKSKLDEWCLATDCVLVSYSTGTARLLKILADNPNAQWRILWHQSLASAAGGSDLADITTRSGMKALAKMFLVGSTYASVDQDLTIGNMRNNLSYIQDDARAPMYHVAGNQDICLGLNAWGVLAASGAQILVGYLGKLAVNFITGGALDALFVALGPVGAVLKVAAVIYTIFSWKKKKFCSNSQFPGGYGDGAVPVHSAAGYANEAAYSSHHTGAAKYPLRAYEQIPLFAVDHRGIFKPGVEKGSLRLAINMAATCNNIPASASSAEAASIVYDDVDNSVIEEFTTEHMLKVCGQDALADDALYSTCVGANGCCSDFSDGNNPGCDCGEALCVQSAAQGRSYFTDYNCAGVEYAANTAQARTFDGGGMIGMAVTTTQMRSYRGSDGFCHNAVRAMTAGQAQTTICETYPWYISVSARRVYRKGVAQWGDETEIGRYADEWIVYKPNTGWAYCP